MKDEEKVKESLDFDDSDDFGAGAGFGEGSGFCGGGVFPIELENVPVFPVVSN